MTRSFNEFVTTNFNSDIFECIPNQIRQLRALIQLDFLLK